MSRYKLLALDMDGTTLLRDLTMSDATRRALQDARYAGVEVTFATGRHRRGLVSDTMRELGFSMPFVTMNGGEVWTADGTLLARHVFAPEEIQYLFDLAQKLGLSYWGGTIERTLWEVPFPKVFEADMWLKFGFHSSDPLSIQDVWHILEEDGRFELTNSNPLNIEVNPKGVNKAKGLQVVCEHLGLQSNEVITMGDSLNDIAMLKWAGLGIAMGNAQDAVKAIADAVTTSVDEDGVARAIREMILKES